MAAGPCGPRGRRASRAAISVCLAELASASAGSVGSVADELDVSKPGGMATSGERGQPAVDLVTAMCVRSFLRPAFVEVVRQDVVAVPKLHVVTREKKPPIGGQL